MGRPSRGILLAISLVSLSARRSDSERQPPCYTGSAVRTGVEGDLQLLGLLRDRKVQEKLGLSEIQEGEIRRRLDLALDADQDDLIEMILRQDRADRDRLRDLGDPAFDDDEEGRQDELPMLRAMADGLPGRSAAMIDRVLTPAQRTALGSRPRPDDLETLVRDLADLQRENAMRIAESLRPYQREQLRQLAHHAEDRLANARPEVVARHRMSDDQATQVRAIGDRARAELDRLRDPSPISPAYRDGDDLEARMRPRLAKIRRESARILLVANERIARILARR
jgi:hypothetical protein